MKCDSLTDISLNFLCGGSRGDTPREVWHVCRVVARRLFEHHSVLHRCSLSLSPACLRMPCHVCRGNHRSYWSDRLTPKEMKAHSEKSLSTVRPEPVEGQSFSTSARRCSNRATRIYSTFP